MGVGGRGSSRNGRLEMLHSGQTAFPCNAIKRNSIQFNAIRIYEASGDVLEHPGASGSIQGINNRRNLPMWWLPADEPEASSMDPADGDVAGREEEEEGEAALGAPGVFK